jgi:hypothetical protein
MEALFDTYNAINKEIKFEGTYSLNRFIVDWAPELWPVSV